MNKVKTLKTGIMKLFSPKQDEYSELKSQLKGLEEKLQNLKGLRLLTLDSLSDLRCKFGQIVEEKKKLSPQNQARLQERILKFLERYEEYHFEKSIDRSKLNSTLNQDNRKNSEMHTTNYNLRLSSSPVNTEQTFQTNFYGKWEKPDSEHVLFNKETNRTPDSKSATQKEVSEINDVEMKDLPDRNKEDKNGNSQRGKFTTNENSGSLCYPVDLETEKVISRRSNQAENFQQNQNIHRKEAFFYETYKNDHQTKTTSRLQNYNIAGEVYFDSYVEQPTTAKLVSDHKQDRSFSSRRSPVQQEQAREETFMSSNRGLEHSGRYTRGFQQHEDKCCRETHFDAPQQNWRSLESASSRILRSVSRSCETESSKTGASQYVRSSRNQYHLCFDPGSRDVSSHHSPTEHVKIQIEEENTNCQKQEKSFTRKNQKSKEEVSRRFIHEYPSKPNQTFSTGVVLLEKDGITTIITQEKERDNQDVVGRNYQHQCKQSTKQKHEEKVPFYQGKDFQKLGNESSEQSFKILQDSKSVGLHRQQGEDLQTRQEVENHQYQYKQSTKQKQDLRKLSDESTEQSFINKDRTLKNVGLLSQHGEDSQTRQEVRNYQQFTRQKQEENVQFDHFENKGRALKNVGLLSQQNNLQTWQEVRGRGKLTSQQTVPQSDMKESTRNYQDQTVSSVDEKRIWQQNGKSPGIAKPVHNSQESYHRTEEIEVATEAVEEEPLQIIDVHKLFQDNFDLKSLNGRDAVTQIETVKKWAETFEEKVSNFSEAKFSLEYFVLDEKLMRFIEHLDKLKCREDPVATQKKIEVIEYIKSLQKTLDSRATDQ